MTNPIATVSPTETVLTCVRQDELIELIRLGNEITRMEADYGNLKTTIIDLIAHGAQVENGVHIAEIKLRERGVVSWKDEFIALGDKFKGPGAGQKMADKLNDNPPKKSTWTELKVDGKVK
jgi:hypothetical protein